MKLKRALISLWAMLLCLCLCACDLGAMLGDFGSFLDIEADEQDETLPSVSIPVSTTAPTEATEATVPPTTAPTEPEPELYWVCALGGLNVRSGPGKEYSSIGSIDDGFVVEPLQWVNGWVYIDYPIVGWCSGDYLHPLGWYNQVQLPVGNPLEDRSLVGKWVHATQPIPTGSDRYARAGILELNADGTFTHSIADFISYTAGRWTVRDLGASSIIWEGEYQFDGETLTLNYMAYIDIHYDSQSGKPKSREWFSAVHTLSIPVTYARDTSRFSIPSGNLIPCYAGFVPDVLTLTTVLRAPNNYAFPEDACVMLARWLG